MLRLINNNNSPVERYVIDFKTSYVTVNLPFWEKLQYKNVISKHLMLRLIGPTNNKGKAHEWISKHLMLRLIK